MRILFLSHTHAFGAFRVGSHHLSRELAWHGHDVIHYSTPISLPHRVMRRRDLAEMASVPTCVVVDSYGVRHIVPRVAVPAGVLPPPIERHLKRSGIPTWFDYVLIDQPLLWSPALRRLGRHIVYRPTDLYPAGLKARLQRRILSVADAVVATSSNVRDSLGEIGIPSLILENGVELSRFPRPTETERPPVAVYVGALDERFDTAAIDAIAREAPGWRIRIAGPGPTPSTVARRNVEYVGPIPYVNVPAFLGAARVGLLPLSWHPLNEGRSPMKLYEYLAAGLTVVTRETAGLQTDQRRGIFAYKSTSDIPMNFTAATLHSSPNLAGRRAAEEMSWDRRAAVLERFLAEVQKQ